LNQTYSINGKVKFTQKKILNRNLFLSENEKCRIKQFCNCILSLSIKLQQGISSCCTALMCIVSLQLSLIYFCRSSFRSQRQ